MGQERNHFFRKCLSKHQDLQATNMSNFQPLEVGEKVLINHFIKMEQLLINLEMII